MSSIGVYMIINPSKRIYIGKSINIERRIKGYSKLNCKSQPKLYRSIVKYGWDAHEHVILECKEDQLDMVEKYYISWYKTIKFGLNCMQGGGGCMRPTDEQRKRMGDSKKGLLVGSKNPMYGKTWSEDRKATHKKWLQDNIEKIRETARRTSMGRVYSQESRDKKSKSLMGHPVSEAVRQRLRDCRSKPIMQFTIDGVFINEFPSAKTARLETGIHNVSICAAGKLKTAGGFKWEYQKCLVE